jgi:hypothetical protein
MPAFYQYFSMSDTPLSRIVESGPRLGGAAVL